MKVKEEYFLYSKAYIFNPFLSRLIIQHILFSSSIYFYIYLRQAMIASTPYILSLIITYFWGSMGIFLLIQIYHRRKSALLEIYSSPSWLDAQ